MSDECNLEAVERLIPIAEQAGLSLTHMAMAFVMAHPGVTSAILGPRTMQHLDDLLAGAEVVLDDELAPPSAPRTGRSLTATANFQPVIRRSSDRASSQRLPSSERFLALRVFLVTSHC